MTRYGDSLKAELTDYAEVDAPDRHEMTLGPGDLWGHPGRACVCGVVSVTSYYEHAAPIGAALFCVERGLPDEAVDVAVRLVLIEGVTWELDALEKVLRGLLS